MADAGSRGWKIDPAGSVRQPDPPRPEGLAALSGVDLAAELLHRLRSDRAARTLLREAEVRVGLLLSDALEERLDVHQNRMSRARYRDLFENLHRTIGPPRPPLHDATYVDLGCGAVNPCGLLFLFLMLGVRRGIAVDFDGVQDVGGALTALADLAAMLLVDPASILGDHAIAREEVLRNLAGFDLSRIRAGDLGGIDATRLDYRQESVHAMSLHDGEADVVVSNAFLEHIERVDDALAELARITRRGGFGIHVIDGRDHRSFEDKSIHALEFLRTGGGAAIVNGCNRIRPLAFARQFERHGFEVRQVVPFERIEFDESMRAGFSEPFRSQATEELAVTQAKIVVTRR